ncbi:hypothetical protein DFP93_105152 [Aneurinibacillus soli]|uniref:Uncharacterized protein n=1 Tax=Aneurinibacillus soli TaxID=1500254 RepID=A0A0U5BAE6_9BACL|nr:hypothetical protein [Aneurinibacillus soli]PYE62198.1 hypothetical protein DFP93_105152 [Aneurinibacillus soli]BAU28614.1 hypothetical protein CB4_02789 [Aneurinibacillus soli]
MTQTHGDTQEQPVNKPTQALISFICGTISLVLLLLFFSSMIIRAEGSGLVAAQMAMLWLMLSVLLALFGFILGLLSRYTVQNKKLASLGLSLSCPALIVTVLMPLFTVIMYYVRS